MIIDGEGFRWSRAARSDKYNETSWQLDPISCHVHNQEPVAHLVQVYLSIHPFLDGEGVSYAIIVGMYVQYIVHKRSIRVGSTIAFYFLLR